MPRTAPPPAPAGWVRVRVWDLPTRVFHLLLACAVAAAVVSAKIGGEAMLWHQRFGLLVLALLLFRAVWGFAGGRWSRFASFVHGPRAVVRSLRGEAGAPAVGHSPLGSLSVWAMLAVLALQAATGLVADDEIAWVGPLNRFVAVETGIKATGWHAGPGQALVLALVALHLAAIGWYRWRGRVDLVGPMVVGDKVLPPDTPASADGPRHRALALALALACAALVVWIERLRG